MISIEQLITRINNGIQLSQSETSLVLRRLLYDVSVLEKELKEIKHEVPTSPARVDPPVKRIVPTPKV